MSSNCESLYNKIKQALYCMFEFVESMQISAQNKVVSKALRNWVRYVYGKYNRVELVLEDVWQAEMWVVQARQKKLPKKDIFDSCGVHGNLHFLLLLLYDYLGFVSEDFVYFRMLKQNNT